MSEQEKTALSEGARHLLVLLGQGFVPKSTVEEQWSPETRQEFQELIQAGIVEEIVVYRIVEPR